jgi:RHS repeat-associated protein
MNSTRSLIGAFVGWLAFAAMLPISASADPLPIHPEMDSADANGVILSSGQFTTVSQDLSIGPRDHHGLTLTRQWQDANRSWSFLEVPRISGSIYTPTVYFMGRSVTFVLSGSTYLTSFPFGDSLSSDRKTFTSKDGTIIHFDLSVSPGEYADTTGTSVLFSDGEQWNYNYKIVTVTYGSYSYNDIRLSSINNASGYQIKLGYDSDVVSTGGWYTLNNAIAINNAVEACNPLSDICSVSSSWPRVDYAYDNAGSTYVTTANGTTIYELGQYQHMVGIRKPDDSSASITIGYDGYERVNAVTRIADSGSSTWTYQYGNPVTHGPLVHYQIAVGGPVFDFGETVVTDPLGKVSAVASDMYGFIWSSTDELGHSTIFNRCRSGDANCTFWLVNRITSPDGDYAAFKHDARGNVIETRHVAKPSMPTSDVIITASYSPSCSGTAACNKPLSTTDANNNTTIYTYDSATGALLTETRPAVNGVSPQTRYTYDNYQAYYKNSAGTIVASGVPIQKLVQVSECRTTASCTNGTDETKTLTGYGAQTSGVANNLLPVLTQIAPSNETYSITTTMAYDGIGNLIASDGPMPGSGDTTYYRYNANRQATGKISPDPDGSGGNPMLAERTTYDARGRPIKSERGSITSVPAETVAPASWSGFTVYQTAEIGFNAKDQKTWDLTRGSDNVVKALNQYSYDAVGRLECTAVRMNSATWGSLPSSACTLGTTGSNGPDRIAKNLYDDAGQLVQVRKGVGTSSPALEQASATYTYTANGKQEYVIDANGNRAKFEYDGFDRLKKWIFPSTTRPSSYNPSTVANALSTAGSINTSDYEQYDYDPNGNRTSLRKRDTNVIGYSYDALNRVLVKDIPGTTSGDVYYGYDLRGLQLFARFGSTSGQGITSTYDGFGRLATNANNVGGTSRTLSYEYDAEGNRKKLTFPDSQVFNFDYDGLDRMVAVKEGSTQVATLAYDNHGLRTGLTGGVTTAYTYDGIGRIASLGHDFSGTGQDVTYTLSSYNAASQLLGQTISNDDYVYPNFTNANSNYTTNGLNQYTAVGSAGFCYDANANLTGDGTYAYKYDVENRLIERHATPGGSCPVSYAGTTNITLTYDPNGRLVQTVGGATTQFLYDGDELVAEYDGSGTLLRRYVHGPSDDDPLFWYEGSNLSDRRPLRSDHLGSIVNVANSSGATISILSYDEYGLPASSNLGRFQYTGQIWMPEAGLYYYKARMYAPKLGRFLQTDPIGYKDQINLYAYVGNDPINRADPSGAMAMNCSFSEKTGSGSCETSDDGKKDLTLTTSLTDKAGHTSSLTKTYSAAYVARVGRLASFVNAQYRYGMGSNISIQGPSILSQISGAFSQMAGAFGFGRPSGPAYQTESEAREAAARNGWRETNQMSPGGKGKFYRDDNGNLWTRDRDGHNGGAWKQYDRTGNQRLGTYDENLNKVGK